MDTRIKHAREEMDKAKKYISLLPGSNYRTAKWLRSMAYEHLGHVLHALQDVEAHMDAGIYKPIPWNKPSSHGMEGVMVQARDDGNIVNMEVELLYDNVLWDFTPEEGWHRHRTKQEGTRWQRTKEVTKQYLYEFLIYGYGSGK